MAFDDDYSDDIDDAKSEDGGEGEEPADPQQKGWRDWLAGKRGWIAIIALAILQLVFATVMIMMRSDARPVKDDDAKAIKSFAVDMLGHEVAVKQIFQAIPGSGGKRMTIGLDLVLVLGQLPEERIEGAPRPNAEEMEKFMAAIQDMEPRIRSRVNTLLQRIPADEYARSDVQNVIKEDIKSFVNAGLEGLDFGKGVRKDIGKGRVTEVLLPMFVRQRF